MGSTVPPPTVRARPVIRVEPASVSDRGSPLPGPDLRSSLRGEMPRGRPAGRRTGSCCRAHDGRLRTTRSAASHPARRGGERMEVALPIQEPEDSTDDGEDPMRTRRLPVSVVAPRIEHMIEQVATASSRARRPPRCWRRRGPSGPPPTGRRRPAAGRGRVGRPPPAGVDPRRGDVLGPRLRGRGADRGRRLPAGRRVLRGRARSRARDVHDRGQAPDRPRPRAPPPAPPALAPGPLRRPPGLAGAPGGRGDDPRGADSRGGGLRRPDGRPVRPPHRGRGRRPAGGRGDRPVRPGGPRADIPTTLPRRCPTPAT